MNSITFKIKRNLDIYKKTSYLSSSVFMWCVMTLYFVYKGLDFTEIALLQSIGAVFEILFEIPTGVLSDKRGHAFVLKISSVSRVVAVFFLFIFNQFYLLILSELFFAIASSAQSGANTALVYESLKKTESVKGYSSFLADIRGKQAIIRLVVRIITPVVFSFNQEIPIILSAVIYLVIGYFTFKLTEPSRDNQSDADSSASATKLKIRDILKRKVFIVCSILSAVVFVVVSNYSQYIGPFLQGAGFNIAFLGAVYAFGSLGEYLGSKFTKKIADKKSIVVLFTLPLVIFIFCILGGVIPSFFGGAIAYFGISMVNTPFSILLSEQINKSISSKYRATLLSVSNQISQFLSIIADPIIGYSIDYIGFNRTYFYFGSASIILITILVLIWLLFFKANKKESPS